MRQSAMLGGFVLVSTLVSAAGSPVPKKQLAPSPPVQSSRLHPTPCASGIFLYAGVWSPPEIHTYCVQVEDGTLVAQDVLAAPGDVRDLQVSADGHSLFYAHADLTEYSISTDGSLTLVGSVPVGSGAFFDLALDPSDPSGRMLYGSHSSGGGRLYVYDTQAATVLPALAQTVSGLYLPHGIAIRSAGDRIHVANGFPQEIHTYPLATNGLLITGGLQISTFEPRPHLFAVPSALPLLYWTESPGGSVLTGNASGSGPVTHVDSIFSGYGAGSLLLDDAGTHLYVLNNSIIDDLTVFGVDAVGDLDAEQIVDTPRRPEHLAFGPGGTRLYVAGAGDLNGSSTIAVYEVVGGQLVDLLVPVSFQQGVFRLAVAQP